MLHAMIMAGGAGTRFWPASRKATPKQLLRLVGERTMLQATVDRIAGLCPAERIMVATNAALVPAIRQQLPDLREDSLIGEPAKRDTAPAIALAAALLERRDSEAVMVVMPSDQVIEPAERFRAAVEAAAELVASDPGLLVTFGIQPTYPAEVFGYIERDAARPLACPVPAWRVARFREKPDAATARRFIDQGGFFWNAGIFIWRAATVLAALRGFEPEMMERIDRIAGAWDSPEREAVFAREFAAIQGRSIDYAVMERHDRVAVIAAPFAWDDLGSWLSLARQRGTDENGNTVDAHHLGIRTARTVVRGEPDHLIVTLGVSDLIVVQTPDATLIARREDEAAVKQVVDALAARGWDQYL